MSEVFMGLVAGFWGVLGEMAPYLLFGFAVAGLLSVLISPRLVERHLGGGGIGPILKASLFGIPLPLCSCGVIPVAAGLRRHGASRGATTSFLISTPQDGVDSIMVTFALLGPLFAIFRPIVALVSGVAGGLAVTAATRKEAGGVMPQCSDACCADVKSSRIKRAVMYGFVTLPRDIGRELLIGLFIAALISAIVPDNYFAPMLGGGIVPILVLMLLGIPIYVCATASVPVAAALIAAGVSPGAALAFLMTGPATNAATIVTVWRTMGRRTALVYLASVAVFALLAGLTLDMLFTYRGTQPGAAMPHLLPEWGKSIAAVALLGLLGYAALRGRPRDKAAAAAEDVQTARVYIEGMHCSRCAEAIRQALLEVAGVESAQVDLDAKEALVIGSEFELAKVREAVESLGYKVKESHVEPAGLGDMKEEV